MEYAVDLSFSVDTAGIEAAFQELAEAVRKAGKYLREVFEQLFPIIEVKDDYHEAEAKKECSVKAFVLRILSRPRRFWEKLVRRFIHSEVDN